LKTTNADSSKTYHLANADSSLTYGPSSFRTQGKRQKFLVNTLLTCTSWNVAGPRSITTAG